MKKTMLMLFTVMFMFTTTACSTGTGNTNTNGNGTIVQTPKDGKTTEPPVGEGTLGLGPSNEKKTIVFSTFFPNETIKEAKKKYEAKHPNITIEFKYIETDDANFEINLEKFIKTTGTAMLSGKGPDLIEMDQLPSNEYISKHLLANMGEMIEQDPTFKKEQFFTNILDGMNSSGGIYGMPLGFFIYGLMGNETEIQKSGVKFDDSKWNWTQFIDVAKDLVKNADQDHQYALGRTMPEYMLTQLVNDQYATFIKQKQKKASFESDSFIGLLKQVKSLFDEKIVSLDTRFPMFREVTINSPSDYIRELRLSEFIPNNRDYKSKLYLKPNADAQKTGGFFRTYQTIGINEKSSVKAEAWDFLKFIISDEMQAESKGTGFSINKTTYQKKAQELLKVGKVESEQQIGPMKGKVFDITQKDIDDLERFIKGAIYPVQFKSSKIDQILIDESKAYFSGQKSPEAVAKLIQNRVTTILNE